MKYFKDYSWDKNNNKKKKHRCDSHTVYAKTKLNNILLLFLFNEYYLTDRLKWLFINVMMSVEKETYTMVKSVYKVM